MKKMCLITTIPFTMQAFVLDTAAYLRASADIEIVVICDYEEDFAAQVPEGIRYIPVPMRRGIDFWGLITVLRLLKIFRQEGFDLVQYSTPNAAFYASIAATMARVPVRLYAQWGVVYVGFTGLKRATFKTVEKIICGLSTRIEPDSKSNLRFCLREGLYPTSKSSVIWNGSADGVNLVRFDIRKRPEWRRQLRDELMLSRHAVVFGFVGRITKDKGVGELLQAFRTLLTRHSDIHLLLVGEAENVDSLDSGLYDWALGEPHILFCGYIRSVEEYFAAMDVFVLPSYREGFGSVIIEAEAMGVPVIVSDIPGPIDAIVPEVTGLLVQKRSVDGLLTAMEMMIGDESLREAMGRAGHEFAEQNFDHSILVDHILEDRKRLLGLK